MDRRWAIEPEAFGELLTRYRSAGPERARVASARLSAADIPYEVKDGVATIEIIGPISKYGNRFWSEPSSAAIADQVEDAAEDPAVKAIVLVIDSPGGTVSGTEALADAVFSARQVKPVTAFVSDLCASAAYWIGSQASRIVANVGSALVGSIGIYGVVYDWSAMFEEAGVKAWVIKAGQFKGIGVTGSEVTEAQRAELQRVIDSLNTQFIAGVARGRGIDVGEAASLADGRIYAAADAIALGLIDAIESKDEMLARVRQATAISGRAVAAVENGGQAMTDQAKEPAAESAATKTEGPKPASAAELKASFPRASAEFREKCQLDGTTLGEAKDRWIAQLEADKAASEAKLQEQRKAAEASAAAGGVEPVKGPVGTNATAGAAGDPVAEYNEAINQKLRDAGGSMKRHEAALAVNREQPELRQAMVAAYNASHGRG